MIDKDPLYDEAVKICICNKEISPSMLQQKFHIGYMRANRIINQLETEKIIGPFNGAKPRKVLHHQ